MKSVLVIDDEPAIRKALQRALVSAGHPVQLANNGTEGLDALKAQTADIVIVDIIMPRVNGVDTIRAIVREFPNVRIIAISGGGNFSPAEYQPHAIKTEAYLAAATVAGAHAVLTKPFRTQDVTHAISTVTNLPSGNGSLI
jgi:CheY-like chemotaxis protein